MNRKKELLRSLWVLGEGRYLNLVGRRVPEPPLARLRLGKNLFRARQGCQERCLVTGADTQGSGTARRNACDAALRIEP